MLKGIYTAASGMIANMVATDTLANNLANVNTAGFKKNAVNFQSFPEMLLRRITSEGNVSIGGLMTGSAVRSTAVDFNQGAVHQTGNPLDVALEGKGYFTVKSLGGETFYTRDGSFTVSADGYLTTRDGMRVQGQNGDIQIPRDQAVQITTSGQISAGGQLVDGLRVTRFQDERALQKTGNNLFQAPRGTRMETAGDGYRVHQGSVESSNVNPISELVNSITGLRIYEALQKNLHIHNETLQKAVTEVGRYR